MGEGVGGADVAAAGDDFAHRRKDLVGLRVEEFADGEVALGHPGAFVEQARGFEEGREIDLHRCAAQRLHASHRCAEQPFRLGVAEELEILRPRHAEAETGRAAEVETMRRQRTRILIGGIEAGGDAPARAAASSAVSAKIDTASSERQAGTTPRVRQRAAASA